MLYIMLSVQYRQNRRMENISLFFPVWKHAHFWFCKVNMHTVHTAHTRRRSIRLCAVCSVCWPPFLSIFCQNFFVVSVWRAKDLQRLHPMINNFMYAQFRERWSKREFVALCSPFAILWNINNHVSNRTGRYQTIITLFHILPRYMNHWHEKHTMHTHTHSSTSQQSMLDKSV